MSADRVRRQLPRQHVHLSIQGLTLRSKVWAEVDGVFAIGEGGVELLRAIEVHGSLAGAAQAVGWSYRHAWGYLRRAEAVLGASLTAVRNGKGASRGAILTPAARDLIRAIQSLTA